jgi:hypothetical protein
MPFQKNKKKRGQRRQHFPSSMWAMAHEGQQAKKSESEDIRGRQSHLMVFALFYLLRA